jgi:hypothetical protein
MGDTIYSARDRAFIVGLNASQAFRGGGITKELNLLAADLEELPYEDGMLFPKRPSYQQLIERLKAYVKWYHAFNNPDAVGKRSGQDDEIENDTLLALGEVVALFDEYTEGKSKTGKSKSRKRKDDAAAGEELRMAGMGTMRPMGEFTIDEEEDSIDLDEELAAYDAIGQQSGYNTPGRKQSTAKKSKGAPAIQLSGMEATLANRNNIQEKKLLFQTELAEQKVRLSERALEENERKRIKRDEQEDRRLELAKMEADERRAERLARERREEACEAREEEQRAARALQDMAMLELLKSITDKLSI